MTRSDDDPLRPAARAGSPWWFHVGLGLLVGQHVLAVGRASEGLAALSAALLILGAVGLVALAYPDVGWPPGPAGTPLLLGRFAVAALGISLGAVVSSAALVTAIAVLTGLATVLLGWTYDAARHRGRL